MSGDHLRVGESRRGIVGIPWGSSDPLYGCRFGIAGRVGISLLHIYKESFNICIFVDKVDVRRGL